MSPPFIKRDAFIDQLLQLIHFLMLHVHKPNPERSIDGPLYASLFNQNRNIISWDNQLDGNLLSWLDLKRAFHQGATKRQIEDFSFHFMRICPKQALDLSRHSTVTTSLHGR